MLTQWRKQGRWKLLFAGIWLTGTATVTALDLKLVQNWERQFQSLFFEMRGPVAAPQDIVILAIDDESLDQVEHYLLDPEKHAALEPIQRFPWQRRAYAIAIERLIESGAKAIALDILLTTESTYGPDDDVALAAVLERYGEQVALAATLHDSGLRQGLMQAPSLPLPMFRETPVHLGVINVPKEADNRIHKLGGEYLRQLANNQRDLDATSSIKNMAKKLIPFADAALNAAGIDYPPPKGPYVNFYGPSRTFLQVPFWYVLDPDPWQNYLDNGAFFQDKIVLIGATASSLQDFHSAPFSATLFYSEPMAGVEIQANMLATLKMGNALPNSLAQPHLRGLLILGLGLGFMVLLWRVKRPLARLSWTFTVSSLWFGLCFVLFAHRQVVFFTAMPIAGFLGIGAIYVITDIITEQFRNQRLRKTLAQYVTSPVVQKIISQEEYFHDLLKAREAEVIGLVLAERYRITKLLGAGGFGETYVAEDTQRPGSPICVVKQLKIISDDPRAHDMACRLFASEAATLEQLGHHSQIPRLLAYFEAQFSFYLVEEMIVGHLLRAELASRKPLPQAYGLSLLHDLLPVVRFVHSEGVIHRDIKPANIIRRKSDQRLVLIDFGAVKQISNRLIDNHGQATSTIGIGTQGYMPSEQSSGLPGFYSDIYALGVTVIEALTGIPAYALNRDSRGEIIWKHAVPELHNGFAAILERMVRYSFPERYSSVNEIITDLAVLEPTLKADAAIIEFDPSSIDDIDVGDYEDTSTKVLSDDWHY